MIQYLNQVFDVIKGYVAMLYQLNIASGVSIGSLFLVSSLLWVITVSFWHRS